MNIVNSTMRQSSVINDESGWLQYHSVGRFPDNGRRLAPH